MNNGRAFEQKRSGKTAGGKSVGGTLYSRTKQLWGSSQVKNRPATRQAILNMSNAASATAYAARWRLRTQRYVERAYALPRRRVSDRLASTAKRRLEGREAPSAIFRRPERGSCNVLRGGNSRACLTQIVSKLDGGNSRVLYLTEQKCPWPGKPRHNMLPPPRTGRVPSHLVVYSQ